MEWYNCCFLIYIRFHGTYSTISSTNHCWYGYCSHFHCLTTTREDNNSSQSILTECAPSFHASYLQNGVRFLCFMQIRSMVLWLNRRSNKIASPAQLQWKAMGSATELILICPAPVKKHYYANERHVLSARSAQLHSQTLTASHRSAVQVQWQRTQNWPLYGQANVSLLH